MFSGLFFHPNDIPIKEAKAVGLYRFNIFHLGEYIDVVIDDILPREGRACPSTANEWWGPLYEKAFAKFHGSYKNLIGGNAGVALTELTGGIQTEMVSLKTESLNTSF